MKIISHGKTYEYICDGCGCRYVAGENEVTNCGFFFKSVCPECGAENKYTKEMEKKTQESDQ